MVKRMNHRAELAKALTRVTHRRSTFEVFSDFVELSALAISNAVDLAQQARREARYLEIVKRWEPEEFAAFPQLLGRLALALEEEPADVLGAVFMDLELGNKWAGQFFTPQCLSDAMAALAFGEDLEAKVREKGYVTLCEPAVGGGALVIAACKAMKEAGLNYQRELHVTAVDVDERAVHMAYLQLSLLHVPAVVVHGNTLTLQERAHWYTPAHVLGLWSGKLQRQGADLQRTGADSPAPAGDVVAPAFAIAEAA